MARYSIYMLTYFAAAACGLGFTGQIVGIPEDALEIQNTEVKSPVVNGLNYQSRIDVRLTPIVESKTTESNVFPVKKSYDFDVSGLHNGEYQLTINSYDFTIQNSRYKVVVDEEKISVYEDKLGAKALNQSSMQIVGPKRPLFVEVVGYKEYYESPQGKISEMVMNSPFGFIFRNSLYTTLFVAAVVTMVLPYVISIISPELAEEMKQSGNPKMESNSEIQSPAQPPAQPPAQVIPKNTSGKAKGARQRK